MRGLSKNISDVPSVEPNLFQWSPFIGPKTRKGPMIMNTEHRKVHQENGEIESDCREVTEERLLELLQQATLKEVTSFTKQLGIKPKGSKLDIIMQIKRNISKDNEMFKKAVEKLWGHSGGIVTASCPHGVVYALKFVLRAESPRDYVDILLSMQHQPNIVIVDMANMVSAHGNKREFGMFYPHNGMLAEPNQANIEAATEGNLTVSLNWLTTTPDNLEEVDEGGHPITESSIHLCLFDRFHEGNESKPKEILRRITHVPQLNGILNTQREEQLNFSINKDRRLINQMKPVNHLFLFHCIMDIRKEKINDKTINNLEAMSSFKVVFDINGRAVIDPSRKHSNTSVRGEKRPRKRQLVESSEDPFEAEGNSKKKARFDDGKVLLKVKPKIETRNVTPNKVMKVTASIVMKNKAPSKVKKSREPRTILEYGKPSKVAKNVKLISV